MIFHGGIHIYSDWPLSLASWILFCVGFWLAVQVVMVRGNIRNLETELKVLGEI